MMSGRTQGYCFFGACRQAAGGELCPEDLFAFWKPFEALQAPRTMTFSKRPARPELIFSPRCHAQRSRSLGAHGVFFLQPQRCQGGGKWINGDTSGLTTHASSRSEKPAAIEIFHFYIAQYRYDSYLLEACHLSTPRAIFRRSDSLYWSLLVSCYHRCGCENITHALDQCLLAASILTSAIISDVRTGRHPSAVIRFHYARGVGWLF
jgi:hypothetical protein